MERFNVLPVQLWVFTGDSVHQLFVFDKCQGLNVHGIVLAQQIPWRSSEAVEEACAIEFLSLQSLLRVQTIVNV